MRIMWFRLTAVARVLAIIYGVFGLTYVPTLLLMGAKEMILLRLPSHAALALGFQFI